MEKNKKKKTKIVVKNPKRILIFFIIIITIIVISNITKNNKIEHKDYLSVIIDNEDVTSKLKDEVIFKDNVQFFSFQDVKNCLDSTIYQEKDTIIMTSQKKVAAIKLNDNNLEINGSLVTINSKAYKLDNGTIYLPVSELKNVYDIEISYIEEYKNIVIDSLSKRKEKSFVTRDVLIKKEANSGSTNIDKVERGNAVIIVSNNSNDSKWSKIRTLNGNIGYIKTKYLTNYAVEREEMKQENKINEKASIKKDISKKNIKTYENRKKLAEELLQEAVLKKEKVIQVSFKNGKEKETFQRFKIEATAILKECGITLVIEE